MDKKIDVLLSIKKSELARELDELNKALQAVNEVKEELREELVLTDRAEERLSKRRKYVVNYIKEIKERFNEWNGIKKDPNCKVRV